MTLHFRFDLRAQSELLTFLVISHLATRHSTGQWMSVENAVESTLFWPSAKTSDDDVVRRAMLASRALPLAQAIETESSLVLDGCTLASIFDSNLRLDFSSAISRNIYNRCLDHLLHVKWYL